MANDGSETITVPNIPTMAARVKVEAADNVFFDISNADFTIEAGGPLTRYVATTGSDTSNNCTNMLSPCATLTHAVDQANDGDTINIAAGTYDEAASLLIEKQLIIEGLGAVVQ